MRMELPVCTRCCFCLPLRYGLLTWGYLKLIGSSVVSIAFVTTLFNVLQAALVHNDAYYTQYIIFISVLLVVFLIDVVLNTLFIVGGHNKNVKLLRIFYVYNIVLWVLIVLVVLGCLVLMVPTISFDMVTMSYHTFLILLDLSSSFFNIVMHTYFLLLLRSEIIKLRSNCEFRFVNNAAEAECVMKYKEGIADAEKGTDDAYGRGTEDVCGPCEKTCHNKGKCLLGQSINDDEI